MEIKNGKTLKVDDVIKLAEEVGRQSEGGIIRPDAVINLIAMALVPGLAENLIEEAEATKISTQS